MKIKGIFFDLDGTLINSMDSHFHSWKKILKHEYNYQLNKKKFMYSEGTKLNILIKNLLADDNIHISKQKMEGL